MGSYTRTYAFSDGSTAYGSQCAFEYDALGSSVNNIVNAQVASGAAIADSKLAQLTTASKVALSALVQGTTGQIMLAGGGTAAWGAMTSAYAISGSVVQTVETQSGAVATGTTVIPQDDTIPQITEGDQYLSQAITPGNASNLLLITAVVNLSNNNGSPYIVVALFQDATANALCASQEAPGAQAQVPTCITLRYYMTAGTTSSTTFRIRCGADGAGTTTVNGFNAARKLGGVLISSLSIQEIKA